MKLYVKKTIQLIALLALILVALGVVSFLYLDEPLPKGTAHTEADAQAHAILRALNKPSWDNTSHIRWTFSGRHHYAWDRANHTVQVQWGDHSVQLDLDKQTGLVLDQRPTPERQSEQLVQTAFYYFNNDSFWLAAPYKLFDPGTERSLVTLPDGRRGLKVTYTQGGSTPGDSYVWFVDDNNQPTSFKLWVGILPVGGLEVSWDNFQTLESGAFIAEDHRWKGWLNIKISNIRSR